ncbi:hypothetical protein, partial [Janibacter melonis]|uniref:hypothetical protein n=1 Tax=Janibacter melonis TaxID=262209 RepID=UPI001CD1DA7D
MSAPDPLAGILEALLEQVVGAGRAYIPAQRLEAPGELVRRAHRGHTLSSGPPPTPRTPARMRASTPPPRRFSGARRGRP